MPAFPLQRGVLGHLQPSPSLPAKRLHTIAATKASQAFLKTKQLFQDDRQFALQQAHTTSPRIAARASQHSPRSTSSPSEQQAAVPHALRQESSEVASSLGRTDSDRSANSMADSVSIYHGYAGVNYQSGKHHPCVQHVRHFSVFAFHYAMCTVLTIPDTMLTDGLQASKTLMLYQTPGVIV